MFNSLLNRLTRRKTANPDESRIVHINERVLNADYPSNRISNTKYTLVTFLPKNLLEQFGRFMNIYFLFIACLQLSPILAPVNPATTWVPLTLIFALSAFKEAVDDYYRYKGDKAANTRKYWKLSPEAGGKVEIAAEDIRVGDLIYLRENDEVPCDLVLLKTADAESHCAYVQTANLDGETDLKTRNAVRATATLSEEELLNLRGTIECATPNAEIYKFDSRLKITGGPIAEAPRRIASEDDDDEEDDDHVPAGARRTRPQADLDVPANVRNPIRASHSGYPASVGPQPLKNSTGLGHRRAFSSGRSLPPSEHPAHSESTTVIQSSANANNANNSGGLSSISFSAQPPLPRRSVSGNLSLSNPGGHRRARSLGGASFLNADHDPSSPYYIPEHSGKNDGAPGGDMVFDSNGDLAIPLDPSHTAWQATKIKNVPWVVGVVVYTGNETKVGMNKSIPPSKWTKVDSIVNRATIAVFVLQIVLTILLGATGDFWLVYNANRHWYLQEHPHLIWYNWLIIPLRFLLLMSMMIPISLKVTLDAVKYIYALLIDWDMDMVDPETDTPANCNSSALSEDLGQIDYIFSDKTGTLTENVMVFAQCSINHVIFDGAREGGPVYLDDSDDESSQDSDQPQLRINDDEPDLESPKKKNKADDKKKKKKQKKQLKLTAANDPKLRGLLAQGDPLSYDFCRVLALCNTAMPTLNDDDVVIWKCASPDEEALVKAAAELGFTLKASRADELTLEIDPTGPSYTEKLAIAKKKKKNGGETPDNSKTKKLTGGESKEDAKSHSTSKGVSRSSTKKKSSKRESTTVSGEIAGESDDEETGTSEPSVAEKFKSFIKRRKGDDSKKSSAPSTAADKPEEEPTTDPTEESSPPRRKPKKRVRIAMEDATDGEATEPEDEEEEGPGTTEKYTVLHILEFTSDRKRMSVLLRSHTTNQLVLLMKGADDKVLAALAPGQHKKQIIADVEHFAQLGLRTLCLCQRVVSESEYARWSIQLNKAATAMKDREALVADAYAAIEKDFQFVGITAIEDKLQQGVPETIELLRRAGIKIWMLTGDKHATAVQIATSCNLISPTSVLSGEVFTIEGKTFDTALQSLNATIAKMLPLTRGMGATNTASSTGVRLNSFFDQPQAYKYQHLAVKTAATLDDQIVDIEAPLTYHDETTDDEYKERMQSFNKGKRGAPSRRSVEALRDLKAAFSSLEVGSDPGSRSTRGPGGMGDDIISATPPVRLSSSLRPGIVVKYEVSDSEADHTITETEEEEDDAEDTDLEGSTIIHDRHPGLSPTNSKRSLKFSEAAYETHDGSVEDGSLYDSLDDSEFQAQQYFQQYHDQQFHQPMINPNTKLLPHRTIAGVATGTGGKRELSLVVEGHTLTHLLRPACKARFLQLALQAHTVICCRVTPQQKAQVVELVKHGVSGVAGGKQERTTLAIGDGGNDVSMIQAASVGIGLVGREGLQASRAADFSMAKFRFLAKLILVHGRWSYRRTAFVAHYCLHKSLFLAFMQIFYAFFSGFAGTSLFDSFALASYNVAFTGIPIMFYSLDKDINEQNLLLNPQLYHETQSGRFINTFTILYWFVRSFAQSALVFFCVIMLSHDRTRTGYPSDWISMSNMAYGACVVVQCLTIFIESNQLTYINHIVIWGTLALYFINMMILDVLLPAFKGVIFGLFTDPVFWFGLILAVAGAILPIVALRFIMINFFPTRSQLVQRMEALDAGDYEAFAATESRRRLARQAYIQESHEVASQSKKNKSPNFLMSSIYRIQAAASFGSNNADNSESSESGNKPTSSKRSSKHPSTLHRMTPATPEMMSEDEAPGSWRSNSDTDMTDPDDLMTMNKLIGKEALQPEIVDPRVAMATSETGPGTSQLKTTSTSPPRHRGGKKSSSVDRTLAVPSNYGYGPGMAEAPPRVNKHRSIDRNDSTGSRTKSGSISPDASLNAGWMLTGSPTTPEKPNFSSSEPNLAALYDPTSPTRKSGSISKSPGPTPPGGAKKEGVLKRGIGTSSGSVGSISNKVSPIPSLSQRPQYSIEAGHAGTLQVIPLHMIGRKPGLSVSTTVGKVTEEEEEEEEFFPPAANKHSSFSVLPEFSPSSPGSHKSSTTPSPGSKRARSKSYTPKALESKPESSSSRQGGLPLASPAPPPSPNVSSLSPLSASPPSYKVEPRTSSSAVPPPSSSSSSQLQQQHQLRSSTPESLASSEGTRGSAPVPPSSSTTPEPLSETTSDFSSAISITVASSSSPKSSGSASSSSKVSDDSEPHASSSTPLPSATHPKPTKTKIKVSSGAISRDSP